MRIVSVDIMTVLKEKLVLASKSPRRAEILKAVGWPFEQMAANVDESRLGSEDAVSYVERLARTKAETVEKKIPEGLLLGADTVVVIEGEILGQPLNDREARRMLKLLSGKWHDVLTGVALMRAGQTSRALVAHQTTRVRFCEMGREEIDWYVSTREPLDKAGAYAVQGKAALFIEEIQGDYFNVMGLPVRLVYELLSKERSEDRGSSSLEP
ncbi:MAG: Maf family protein [Acidobacteriota bacterium]|nr:Maf family protein [Acidobacteriota bacterium]